MKNLVMAFVVLALTGCEAIQKTPTVPDNTASTVVDSVREQSEQTQEITDASESIGGTLESIDDDADSILDDIALAPESVLDPTLDSIEDSAESIKERVDEAQLEQVRIEEALEDLDAANARVSAAVGQIKDLEDLVKAKGGGNTGSSSKSKWKKKGSKAHHKARTAHSEAPEGRSLDAVPPTVPPELVTTSAPSETT